MKRTAAVTALIVLLSLSFITPLTADSDDLPPGVTIQRVTASGLWMCNEINGEKGECAILTLEFYNVGQLVDGYGDLTATCIWEDRKTPLDVTGKYFTGGPQGIACFDYAGYTVEAQLINGEYFTFGGGLANDIPVLNPGAFDGFGNTKLEVTVLSPEIVSGCMLGTGLLYTIHAEATGFPAPEVTITGDERVQDMGDGIFQIEMCSTERVELEVVARSGENEQKEYLVLPMETGPAVSLIVLEGPTLVPALSSSGDVYRYVLQATVKGYPVPELEWTNATPAEEGDTTVTVTVPAGYWLWQFPTVSITAENSIGTDSDSLKLPVESLIEDSGAGFSTVSGQVMICPPDKDPSDEDNWEMYDEKTMLTMPLLRGTRIRTGADSEAVIGFSDMATFELKPETTIVIHRPPEQQGKISLVLGNIWANVKNMMKDGSMDIEMNQAVAGIKGTTFECSDDGVTSTLVVHEGEVLFSTASHGAVSVSGGEMVSATSSGIGPVTDHNGTGASGEPPSTPDNDIGDDDMGEPTSSGDVSATSTPLPSYVPPPGTESSSSFPIAYAAIGIVLVIAVALLGMTMARKR